MNFVSDCVPSPWCCSVQEAGTPISEPLTSQTMWLVQSSMKVFKDLGSLDWQPDPIQPLCYELFMSTGAVGQANVIYAILKTFTPICSTVYYILPDNDCIVSSVNPSPLSTSLVQYWNCASVTYCLMWPVRPWRFVLEPVKRKVLSSDVCFGSF